MAIVKVNPLIQFISKRNEKIEGQAKGQVSKRNSAAFFIWRNKRTEYPRGSWIEGYSLKHPTSIKAKEKRKALVRRDRKNKGPNKKGEKMDRLK